MTTPASTSTPPPAPPPGGAFVSTQTLLAFAGFLSGAAIRVCDSLLPRLARDFSLTAGAAGQVIISFGVAYGLMQLLFGPLGDRYGKARMVYVALFGCALAATASALAPDFGFLIATRAAWGMAAAGIVPLAMAWVGDAVPYEQRQAALARLLTGILSGMMLGQLIGGLFGDAAAGWRGAFAMLAVGYAVVGAWLLLRVRAETANAAADSVPAHASHLAQLNAVLGARWSRYVLLVVFLEGFLLLGPVAFLPTHLHAQFGVSLTLASAAVALYAVGGLIYAVGAKRIVPRLGERRMVTWGGALMGLGFVAWGFMPWWQAAGPIALAVGFGAYLFHNTLQTHATQMTPQARGTAVALFAAGLFAGQAAGVSVSGWVFDRWGVAPLLAVPAVMLPLLGVWFARALQRRAKG